MRVPFNSTTPVTGKPSAAAWGTLAILVLLYFLSILDRQLLSLLVVPIQTDLKLSDSQLGAAQGLAFITFYSVMGLMLAYAVDRFSKAWIIFLGVGFWSLSTIACGLANNFSDLFIARLGVGAGEAVLGPAAASLIGLLFPRDRLSLANGIYMASVGAAGLTAFWLGGTVLVHLDAAGGLVLPILGHLKPWQGLFVLAGLLGIPGAFLAFLMSDPKKKAPTQVDDAQLETLREFARRRGVLWFGHALAFGFLTMTAYAVIAWTPTYLTRSFNAGYDQIGLIMGVSFGICGSISQIFWGWIIDRMTRRGVMDAHYRLYFYLVPAGIPIAVAAYLVNDLTVSTILISMIWLTMLAQGPLNAALLVFTPAHLRARVFAGAAFVSSTMAIGLTPFLVGLTTDYVFGDPAKVGLSIALFMVTFGSLGVTILFLLRKRFAAAAAEDQAPAMPAANDTSPETGAPLGTRLAHRSA